MKFIFNFQIVVGNTVILAKQYSWKAEALIQPKMTWSALHNKAN